LSIDLDSTEGRKEYLSEKLDDLLVGINDSYGTLLMEELLNRLELTVKDFNDEMKVLCEQLVVKEKERQQLLEMLKTTDSMVPQHQVESTSKESATDKPDTGIETSLSFDKEEIDEDIPEWEKKLAKLEKGR
tara:strand:- start:601 stop:996 length:396 start_codon:yes stop_codon:yes gene_type:complete